MAKVQSVVVVVQSVVVCASSHSWAVNQLCSMTSLDQPVNHQSSLVRDMELRMMYCSGTPGGTPGALLASPDAAVALMWSLQRLRRKPDPPLGSRLVSELNRLLPIMTRDEVRV